jgi:hypothetical protein
MVGEPIKLATNTVAGRSNTYVGVPICSATPWFMTTMRWARVMAST